MAHVFLCDRCRRVADACETIRGRELCAACIASLDAWLVTELKPGGTTRGHTKAQRNPPEASMAVVTVIAAQQGTVSAHALSDATGEPYRVAYLRLRYLWRKGLIERVAGCVYRLPSAMGEAAE